MAGGNNKKQQKQQAKSGKRVSQIDFSLVTKKLFSNVNINKKKFHFFTELTRENAQKNQIIKRIVMLYVFVR